MYIMEMSNGETLTYMKNRKSIYSRDNDFITIIASAKNNVPGYIRICSGILQKTGNSDIINVKFHICYSEAARTSNMHEGCRSLL